MELLLGVALAQALQEAEPKPERWFVSPDGDDSWSGTWPAPDEGRRDGPFRTLPRALQAARGRPGEKTISLRQGTYELVKPLRLGPEDSDLIVEAYRGEHAILSGGRKITGWRRGEEGLWTAAVKSFGKPIRQLLVNGRRATRARGPAAVRLVGSELSPDRKTLRLEVAPGTAKWRNLPDVEAIVLGPWEIVRKRLESADPAGSVVTLAPPHPEFPGWYLDYLLPRAGWSCFFENAREFLQPGQWCLEQTLLTYRPLPGERMEDSEFLAPALDRLLEIRGRADRPVRNVTCNSIGLTCVDWPLPETGYFGVQAGTYLGEPGRIGAAIECEWAESCSFRDCRVAHIGGSALSLRRGCADNLIQGNDLVDIGANGIMVGETADARDRPRRNTIANNRIRACGADYFGAVGIWIGFSDHTRAAHNLIHDLPYTGVSVGWQWDPKPTGCQGHVIESNHIHDVMKLLSDGGGIYTLGRQPGTILRANLIHDVRRSESAAGAPNNGIFMDEGSSEILVEANTIFRTSATPVRFHKAAHNALRKNSFVPSNGRAYAFNSCDESGMTFQDNSFAVDEARVGETGAGLEPAFRKALLGER